MYFENKHVLHRILRDKYSQQLFLTTLSVFVLHINIPDTLKGAKVFTWIFENQFSCWIFSQRYLICKICNFFGKTFFLSCVKYTKQLLCQKMITFKYYFKTFFQVSIKLNVYHYIIHFYAQLKYSIYLVSVYTSSNSYNKNGSTLNCI